MKFLVFIFLYAFEYIKASKLNLADALNAINEYEAKYGRNVLGPCGLVGENLISEHVKFHDSTSSANYYILVCCELILKREVKSKDDYDCDKIKDKVDHKNVANIWLQFSQEYDGTMIDWTIFEWLRIYDKNIIDSMNEDQKQKITDDQTCGLNYLNEKKIISNNEIIKPNHLYGKRKNIINPHEHYILMFKKFEKDLKNFNAKNTKNNFSNIVNLCVIKINLAVNTRLMFYKDYVPHIPKEVFSKEFERVHKAIVPTEKIETSDPDMYKLFLNKLRTPLYVLSVVEYHWFLIDLHIAVLKEKDEISPKKLLTFFVSDTPDKTYEYHKIILDHELVFSVTMHEEIIYDLVYQVMCQLKNMNFLMHESMTGPSPIVKEFPNYEVIEEIYEGTIHLSKLQTVLNDCQLDIVVLM